MAVNQLRLNFSLATEQEADHGLAALRECLQNYIERQQRAAPADFEEIIAIR